MFTIVHEILAATSADDAFDRLVAYLNRIYAANTVLLVKHPKTIDPHKPDTWPVVVFSAGKEEFIDYYTDEGRGFTDSAVQLGLFVDGLYTWDDVKQIAGQETFSHFERFGFTNGFAAVVNCYDYTYTAHVLGCSVTPRDESRTWVITALFNLIVKLDYNEKLPRYAMTDRQMEMLSHLFNNKNHKEIRQIMNLSNRTYTREMRNLREIFMAETDITLGRNATLGIATNENVAESAKS